MELTREDRERFDFDLDETSNVRRTAKNSRYVLFSKYIIREETIFHTDGTILNKVSIPLSISPYQP